ncbi:MAG TPA: hypothetical protein VGJ29_07545 [Vicinamibacterales bacterium]
MHAELARTRRVSRVVRLDVPKGGDGQINEVESRDANQRRSDPMLIDVAAQTVEKGISQIVDNGF